MNKNFFIVALLALALPTQLYAQKRNKKSPENLKLIAKVLGYTAGVVLTHIILKPNSRFIGAPKGISLAAASGLALYGIGDVFESPKARKYGRLWIFAALAVWLANTEWVNDLLDWASPAFMVPKGEHKASAVRKCFSTLIFLALLESIYNVSTEAKEEYKRFSRSDDYDDED